MDSHGSPADPLIGKRRYRLKGLPSRAWVDPADPIEQLTRQKVVCYYLSLEQVVLSPDLYSAEALPMSSIVGAWTRIARKEPVSHAGIIAPSITLPSCYLYVHRAISRLQDGPLRTWVGTWLRRPNLREPPNFFNVLNVLHDEMSV
jgi:hypothetical protein